MLYDDCFHLFSIGAHTYIMFAPQGCVTFKLSSSRWARRRLESAGKWGWNRPKN